MLDIIKLTFKRILTNKWTVPGVIVYSILAVVYWLYLKDWFNAEYRWYIICPLIVGWFRSTGNREVFTWDIFDGYSRPDVTGKLYHWNWRSIEQAAVALFIVSAGPSSFFDYAITLLSAIIGLFIYEYKFVIRNQR